MTFSPKAWQNSPSTATPITAAALQELESRIAAYADLVAGIAVAIGSGLTYDVTDPLNPVLRLSAEAPFVEVGSGAPAPAFENGATNYGSGLANCAYTKLRSGLVVIRGHVVCTNATIFTLPTGYRPAAALIFPTWMNSAFGTIGVYPSGSVGFGAAPTSVGSMNLAFMAA